MSLPVPKIASPTCAAAAHAPAIRGGPQVPSATAGIKLSTKGRIQCCGSEKPPTVPACGVSSFSRHGRRAGEILNGGSTS
jgi:hypothetical protein